MKKNNHQDDSGQPRELLSLQNQLRGICQNYRAALNQTRSVAHLQLATKVSKGRRYYEARMLRQNQYHRISLGTADNPTVQKLQARRFLQVMIGNLEHDIALLEKTIDKYLPTDPDAVMAELPLAYRTDPARLLLPVISLTADSGVESNAGAATKDNGDMQTDIFLKAAAIQLAQRGIRLLKRKKELHPEHLTQRTAKGPLVRSKSEVVISNSLFARSIPYLNEPLLAIGNTLLAPDFLIFSPKNASFYLWEHWGLMDKPGYLERNINKMKDYHAAGFTPGNNLIITSDTQNGDLDSYQVERILNAWF